jgi:hypothetical protein
MCDPLKLSVFENLKVFGLEIGNVTALRIGDHGVDLHKIDGYTDDWLLLRHERQRRGRDQDQADGALETVHCVL